MDSIRNSYKVLISCLERLTGKNPSKRPWCKLENATKVKKFRVTKFDALFGTFPRMAKRKDTEYPCIRVYRLSTPRYQNSTYEFNSRLNQIHIHAYINTYVRVYIHTHIIHTFIREACLHSFGKLSIFNLKSTEMSAIFLWVILNV